MTRRLSCSGILRSAIRASLICGAFLFLSFAASAKQVSIQSYGVDQGLVSLSDLCVQQGSAGYILVCSEHGLYEYDGRRFINLGPKQGLRAGGVVHGAVLTTTGRLALYYANDIFISDQAADALRPWSSIHFKSVPHPGVTFFTNLAHRVVSWHDGLVLAADARLWKVVISAQDTPHLEAMAYTSSEQELLRDVTMVFSTRGQLWAALENGLLCSAEPGNVRCYGPAEGLKSGPWLDVVMGPGGVVMARSTRTIATFDAKKRGWSDTVLPDQENGRYLNFRRFLGLFHTPDGKIATQSDHGLLILGASGWHLLSAADGVPDAAITDAITDSGGNFWMSSQGRGVMRWIGYGQWQTLDGSDGLSTGLSWQTARSPDGHVWVATDTGLDEIATFDDRFKVLRIIPGSSFVVATGPDGELWSSDGLKGLRIIDPQDGLVRSIGTPPVNAIVPDGSNRMWIGTEAGLLRLPIAASASGAPAQGMQSHHQVTAVLGDDAGGVFYVDNGRLRHRRVDGGDVEVAGSYLGDGFNPVSLSRDHEGRLLIGGEGGLYRMKIVDDRVMSSYAMDPAGTSMNTVAAVMTDHRGWVWAGTTHGVSVNDGKRWVTMDASSGLAADDVNQGGLREDPDGSVWIATSLGLSHLRDPDRLFIDPHIKVVVTNAQVGRKAVSDHLPYSQDPLELLFGTISYAQERSIVFRYRLSGVDADWATTPTGVVRYPFLPPGHHMLEVIGYDTLSQRSSEPIRVAIGMAYPWWRHWWFELLCVTAAVALLQGLVRLRLRLAFVRQAELRRLVAEATAEMRVAQEQLRYQAQHDALTGLLTRSEIEKRLALRLGRREPDREVVVALMDIDHFKAINDGYGHLGGDDVLRSIGMLVQNSLRNDDEAGRYGGEELLIIFEDADGRSAERVLTLHRLIRGTSFVAAGRTMRVTCSVGIAWARYGDEWETLIGRADDALYEAKHAGRDRVVEARQNSGAPDLREAERRGRRS